MVFRIGTLAAINCLPRQALEGSSGGSGFGRRDVAGAGRHLISIYVPQQPP